MAVSDPAAALGELLGARGLTLALAESCTGGWIAKRVTDVAGSSAWFDRGFVTYADSAKTELLGVPAGTLERHGAVSEETVRAMAEGGLAHSSADLCIAVTGVAGPAGGTGDKPVGTVWLAWARRGGETRASRRVFSGDRENVRRASVRAALEGAVAVLREEA